MTGGRGHGSAAPNSVVARVCRTQRHFHVGERKKGFGRLLSELPPLPAGEI